MPIRGLENREDFKAAKSASFFPAKAISEIQNLRGRRRELVSVEKALESPGRQCFIFGERGVGKTSLAKTAYKINFGDIVEPLIVGCEETSSFSSIFRAVIEKGLRYSPSQNDKGWKAKIGVNIGILSGELERQVSEGKVPEIVDVNQAVFILKYLRQTRTFPRAVIIDEFDRIVSTDQKSRFADFLKQASDQDLDIKFIFYGISQDVESLIGSHLSAGRYIAPIELGRLRLDDLW